MTSVLVTGHQGYLGSVMVPVLQSKDHRIIGLDAGYFNHATVGAPPGEIPCLRKDLRDVLPEDISGLDAVIHLAALSNDPLGELNPTLTQQINCSASVNLARLCREAGVSRFLYASSCSLYGAAGEEGVDEAAPLKPLTPYAVSKARTEEEVSKLADASFSPVFLRNATAYGFSPRLRTDLVLNNLVCWGLATAKIRILSDGSAWRPLIHAQDIARAFAAALDAPREKIHNQAFNVGSDGENYRVRDLAAIVSETLPGCAVEYSSNGGPDARSYRVIFRKWTKAFPEWRPLWNARRGAEDLRDRLRLADFSAEDFLSGRYTRLNQLKDLHERGRLGQDLRWLA